MIIRQTTTIVFEYPQDYLQEQEWCKTKGERWIHKSTDTLGAVYENTISYSIGQPKDEPQTDKHKCRRCVYYDISSDYYPCSECVDYSNYTGEIEDEPQTMYYPQVDGITPSVIVKDKSQTERSK